MNVDEQRDDSIECPNCAIVWSSAKEEYGWLREEEIFHCSCGYPLFKKCNLAPEEYSLLQPAPF